MPVFFLPLDLLRNGLLVAPWHSAGTNNFQLQVSKNWESNGSKSPKGSQTSSARTILRNAVFKPGLGWHVFCIQFLWPSPWSVHRDVILVYLGVYSNIHIRLHFNRTCHLQESSYKHYTHHLRAGLDFVQAHKVVNGLSNNLAKTDKDWNGECEITFAPQIQCLTKKRVLAVKGGKTTHCNEELTACQSDWVLAIYGSLRKHAAVYNCWNTKKVRTVRLCPSTSAGYAHHATIPLHKSRQAFHFWAAFQN